MNDLMDVYNDQHVLLGLCDEKVQESSQTSWICNKIGGNPDLMYQFNFKLPKCVLCGCDQVFITQIYCPLEDQSFHRALYVFACVKKPCWNQRQSWTILRSQLSTESSSKSQTDVKKEASTVTMETSDWCDEADDWGADEEDNEDWAIQTDDHKSGTTQGQGSASCSDWEIQTDVLKSGTTQGQGSAASCSDEDVELDLLTQRLMGINMHGTDGSLATSDAHSKSPKSEMFQSYFVNVFDEPDLTDIAVTAHERKLMKDYEQREGLDFREWQEGTAAGKKGGAESYEKTDIKHGDRFFHKFSKRLARCPEQCIRYSWKGNPLYITSPHKTNPCIPCCDYCGAARVFELQLMPPLVSFLKVPRMEDTAVEFGVVLIYTCSASCWTSDAKLRIEYVVVQADPDNDLLNSKRERSFQSESTVTSRQFLPADTI